MSLARELRRLTEATEYVEAVADTIRRIEGYCYRDTGDASAFYGDDGYRYRWEWPDNGETEDGSVEADVYREAGASSVLVGRYRIAGDGKLLEFPHLPRRARGG